MIDIEKLPSELQAFLRAIDKEEQFPAAALLGPRQAGEETTLADAASIGRENCYLDLESPSDD